MIDQRQFDRLGELFCDDIIYQRPGYETLHGIEQLTHFYKEVRVIAQGQHLY
jgi:hypothetical protein